jgi:hypothetical protein
MSLVRGKKRLGFHVPQSLPVLCSGSQGMHIDITIFKVIRVVEPLCFLERIGIKG